jgi:transposase InsO family protein
MREDGRVGKHRRKFRGTTDSGHGLPVAPNLLHQRFEASKPDGVWASDITQLWTPEGWLYLAIVLDLFARYVVGWALRADITRHLVLDAVRMAISWRKPKQGLIFHSDQGSQYAADDTERLLRAHSMTPSMSGVGNCYDNAVSESFFAGFKNELGDTFPSRSQAQTDAFEFIETYYNPYRRHRFNGNISPRDCEAFFARQGRRPHSVKDLIAENLGTLSAIALPGEATTPRRLVATPVTAVYVPCMVGPTPSI